MAVPEKQDDDEDKLFCLSLLKDIKKVPETKRLKLKINTYNLILQNQTVSPPSRYHSPMYNHQYMPSDIVYPNYDTTSYDTPARRHHQDYTRYYREKQLSTSIDFIIFTFSNTIKCQ